MALSLFYVVVVAGGFLVAMLSRRDRLLAMRTLVGRLVSTLAVIAVAGMALVFIEPWLAGALLGFSTSMSHGAAGTVMGSWLRLYINREEYVARRARRQRYGELVSRTELVEVAPDEALFSEFGTGRFVLWCCLTSLLGPVIVFLGAARTGFQNTDILVELVLLLVAVVASGTLIYFAYRLWSAKSGGGAPPEGPAGI